MYIYIVTGMTNFISTFNQDFEKPMSVVIFNDNDVHDFTIFAIYWM